MPRVVSDGTQVAVIGTEHTLDTITRQGTYELQLDTTNMASGDTLEIRHYGRVREGSDETLQNVYTISDAQTQTYKYSLAKITPHYIRYTIKQTAGTGRSYEWAVYSA